MKAISFIFPSPAIHPTGGYKVAYEYANRLVKDGYRVNIVYAGSLFFSQKTLYFKLTNCVRFLQALVRGYSCRTWFPLDRRVKERLAFSLIWRHVPKADRYIATSPYTAMYLKNYPVGFRSKYYFIQGYENWGDVTDAMLRETYHYPINKIVISSWLQGIIESEKESCQVVPNGFDFNYFQMSMPVKEKNRYRITMLYHKMARKGCQYGFAALKMVKRRYPQLRVNLFGTPERPKDLPEWYDYYQSPDRITHNRIYNESAIFLGTSNIEGWGLTVGEAMICGCAVVCTNNSGYLEMAQNEETALVSPIKDSRALAENIIRLIEDDGLRQKLAAAGHDFIQGFSLDSSYQKFCEALHLEDEN